ncbi:hypothetical protein F5141DRAFT_1259538 [Pisolithus sp. B1]|nr:hypothetical protein F5141DRAFT_1259538 [Pisolithus sp. B1]
MLLNHDKKQALLSADLIEKITQRDHTKLWTEMWERISHVESGELKPGWGSFSYIVRGYDAGYYGYTYLLVFAAEMYITVLKWGPLDPIIGQLYHSKILLSGGSQDEVVSLEASCHRYGDEVVTYFLTRISYVGHLLMLFGRALSCPLRHTLALRNLLPSPILTIEEKNAMKNLKHAYPTWPSVTINITFPKEGLPGYQLALQHVCSRAAQAIEDGVKVIILPNHATGPTCIPLSVLMACGGVHHCLVLTKDACTSRSDGRDARGSGGSPSLCSRWLIMETICKIGRENLYVKMGMGVSTLQSYKGARILGVHSEVVEQCFIGTVSRVQGATFDLLALDTFELHECGWPMRGTILPHGIPESDEYHWRDGGEAHINDPGGIASLKDAVHEKNQTAYDVYALNANEQAKSIHLHGLLDFRYENATPIPNCRAQKFKVPVLI